MSCNTRDKSRIAGRYGMIAVCALALAACSGPQVRPDASPKAEKPEEAVKARALKRWTLLIDRDFAGAYQYLSPGYQSVHPQEQYVKSMAGRPVQWTRVLFNGAKCEAESCMVELQVNAQFQMPVMRVGTVEALNVMKESWVQIDGEWYLVPSADR